MNALIKLILSALFKISGEQWATAISLVRALAAKEGWTNAKRADEFLVWFLAQFPGIKPWLAETIRNLAVGFARKKKWIEP